MLNFPNIPFIVHFRLNELDHVFKYLPTSPIKWCIVVGIDIGKQFHMSKQYMWWPSGLRC